MSELIPDYIEPMGAYRAFELGDGGTLCSTAHSVIWEREMKAECLVHGYRNVPEHQAPHKGCSCGIWSLKRLGDIYRHFSTKNHAYAKIQVYGRTFEGELTGYGPGFKSEKARIVEIYVHENVLPADRLALVDRYGVPVLDLPDEPKIDILARQVDDLVRQVERLVANWHKECARTRLRKEAEALGRVEKWNALKSRAHAAAYIRGGRSKTSRPLCNNTRLEFDTNGDPALLLHSTYVATYTEEGLMLDSGNWWTVTTKDRINMAARACTDFDVYSTGEGWGHWAAYKRGWWNAERSFGPIPPWLEGHVELTADGMRSDEAVAGEQMTLDGGSVPMFVAAKISKRTEAKLRREWMRQNGWEIPFEKNMILPYKETHNEETC